MLSRLREAGLILAVLGAVGVTVLYAGNGSLEVTVVKAESVRVPVVLPDGTSGGVDQFAVDAQLRDGSGADVVQICEDRTSLLDESGAPVGRLAAMEYGGGEGKPQNPREFTVRLRFAVVQGDEGKADRLRVGVYRWRSHEIPLEWGGHGSVLSLPLTGASAGLSATVGGMSLRPEQHPEGKQHLVIEVSATATAATMNAPDFGFADAFVETAEGTRLWPDVVQTDLSRAPGPDGCTDQISVCYHFFGMAEVPELSKVSITVHSVEQSEQVEVCGMLPCAPGILWQPWSAVGERQEDTGAVVEQSATESIFLEPIKPELQQEIVDLTGRISRDWPISQIQAEQLIQKVQAYDLEVPIRNDATRDLVKQLGIASVPTIASLALDPNPEVRLKALRVLLYLPPPAKTINEDYPRIEAVEEAILLRYTHDVNPRMRRAALAGLWSLVKFRWPDPPPRSVCAIVLLAAKDPDDSVRIEGLLWLHSIGVPIRDKRIPPDLIID
jgi:hypothetical protein